MILELAKDQRFNSIVHLKTRSASDLPQWHTIKVGPLMSLTGGSTVWDLQQLLARLLRADAGPGELPRRSHNLFSKPVWRRMSAL